ncbi:galactoside alpha-(1,2)-fucosyltransferase 2-like isoform X3 [Ostrea edulis]|uniref:galactoside alpha-(1,2)-fucosyltransferase 2-like isoform X3 n=1 Tax=Ostrea edulis TaxID=37623 RepID=UPI0024AEE7FC|nr:galactoside alpha-(1,2)-fucosyltransferase 2-like isoform X3 [Ostrea edulis]
MYTCTSSGCPRRNSGSYTTVHSSIERSTTMICLRLELMKTIRQHRVCLMIICSMVFWLLLETSRKDIPTPSIACVNFKGRLVGSNDIKWDEEALGAEENVYFSRGLSAAEDMALLSLANHTIMSVGTYGWWIGWMARGTTVYYKHIFVPGSDFSKEFKDNSTEDFVYPGWIPMDESPNGWRDV